MGRLLLAAGIQILIVTIFSHPWTQVFGIGVPGFWDRLLNQIRFFKRMGSKITFFKTRIDARMTPDKKDHTPTHTHTGNMAQGFGRGGTSKGRGKEGEEQEPQD